MSPPRIASLTAWLLTGAALAGCTGSGATGPAVEVAGQPESARTTALETGAAVMQRDAPTDALEIYLVGFHPMKENPQHQSRRTTSVSRSTRTSPSARSTTATRPRRT